MTEQQVVIVQTGEQAPWVAMPNSILEDELSNEAIAMYFLIGESLTMRGYSVTCLGWLVEGLQFAKPSEQYKKFKDALDELERYGYITIRDGQHEGIDIHQVKKNDKLVIYVEQPKEYFQIPIPDAYKVISYATNKGINAKCGLLRYYFSAQRWTNYEGGSRVGYFAQSKAKECATDARTIKQFNEALEELGLFYYDNSYRTEKLHKNTATHFARQDSVDKDLFETIMQQKAESSGWVKYDKIDTGKKISQSMTKYHAEKRLEKETAEELAQYNRVYAYGNSGQGFINLNKIYEHNLISDEEYDKYCKEVKATGTIIFADRLIDYNKQVA